MRANGHSPSREVIGDGKSKVGGYWGCKGERVLTLGVIGTLEGRQSSSRRVSVLQSEEILNSGGSRCCKASEGVCMEQY